MSFNMSRNGKFGEKSRFKIKGALYSTTPDFTIDAIISGRSFSTSTPSLAPSVSASANPSKISAICRFITNLVACPLPVSPMWKTCFPIA